MRIAPIKKVTEEKAFIIKQDKPLKPFDIRTLDKLHYAHIRIVGDPIESIRTAYTRKNYVDST